jgi:hypothetical protein
MDVVTTPDLDKLIRAIGDSFQNATGVDDSRISCIHAYKFYTPRHEQIGVEIMIRQYKVIYSFHATEKMNCTLCKHQGESRSLDIEHVCKHEPESRCELAICCNFEKKRGGKKK